MGVNGLWKLLTPVSRPIQLETLNNKRLAIDASIWIYQFQMTMRDKKTGDPLSGAHIMGTFRRIVKLLYHGMRPVFVFDGDAPMLKKRTIAERKKRKTGAESNLARTAKQLLSAQLRAAATEHQLKKQKLRAEKEAAFRGHDEVEIDPDTAVYLDDLDDPQPSRAKAKKATATTPAKKYVPKDQYALPSLDGSVQSRAKASDPRIATEAELREYIDAMRPEDFDIDSDFFSSLPVEVKYEIVGDLRIKSRQVNHRRVEQMRSAATPLDFSRAQIANVMERNSLTQKLFEVTDTIAQAAITIPTRVAGQKNREYLLIKQDESKGGGWVLGVKDPVVANNEAIVISDDESDHNATDSDDFEEISTSNARRRTPSPDAVARRTLAIEAIRARYAPKEKAPELDPYLDLPEPLTNSASLFDSGHEMDDAEEAELQKALYDSMNADGAGDQSEVQAGIFERMANLPSTREAPKDDLALPQPQISKATDSVNRSGDGEESDDGLEFLPDDGDDEAPRPPQADAAPEKPPSQSTAVLELQSDSDDDEGNFEEVSHTAPDPALASRPSPSVTPARPSPSQSPHPSLSRPSSASPGPSNSSFRRSVSVPGPSKMLSVMDSLLPSDSDDSDGEAAPRPALRGPPKPNEGIRPSTTTPAPPAQPSAVPSPKPSPAPAPKASVAAASPLPPRTAESSTSIAASSQLESSGSKPSTLPSTSHSPSLPVTQVPSTSSSKPRPKPSYVDPALVVPPDLASSKPPSRASYVDPATIEPVASSSRVTLDSSTSEAAPPGAVPTFAAAVADHVIDEVVHEEEEKGADDEVFFDGWERSPTPPARPTGRFGSPPPDFEEEPDPDDEEAMDLEREMEGYADMVSRLNNRDLGEMRTTVEDEIAKLKAQRNVESRNADGATKAMVNDIKVMLQLFGIPFVDAPQEAEAECAELLTRKLVDGIVTDDSDVFLFGGERVYRHMFNDQKYVECYLAADLERELGLDRSRLIGLAYLLGGDYADGLPGVGPVLARELLEEFDGPHGLEAFRYWWSKVQSGKDDENDTDSAWKRRFKRGHKDLFIDETWPDPAISRAYTRPVVNEEDEPFSWAGPDLDGLRNFLSEILSWGSTKVDEIMLPLIRRMNDRKAGKIKYQGGLGDYFDVSAGSGPLRPGQRKGYSSERLQNVLRMHRQKMKLAQAAQDGDKKEEDDDDDDLDLPPPPPKPKAEPRRKKAAVAQEPDDDDDAEEGNTEAAVPAIVAAADAAAAKKAAAAAANGKGKGKKKATTTGAKAPAKSTVASRKRANAEAKRRRAEARGGDLSSDEDLAPAPKRQRGPAFDSDLEDDAPPVSRPRPRRVAASKKAVVDEASGDSDGELASGPAKRARTEASPSS